MSWSTQNLQNLVLVSDSGTWGDEGSETNGSPVLRSTNIQDSRLILEDFAWRIIPKSHRTKKKLDDGDIIVTTSSGSPEHIGKCCIFRQPNDGREYYFSNFTLRLRPDPKRLDSRWLHYWLSSPMGRAILAAMNNTTSGLRNLDRQRYLAQRLPLPSREEQRRIAAILDKADAVRQKHKKAIALTEELLRSAFLEMFGDSVTNPKGWKDVKLEGLLTFLTSGSRGWAQYYASEGALFLRIQNVKGGKLLLDDVAYVDPPDSAEGCRTCVQEGDVLVSITADLGRTAVIPKGLKPAYINQHLALLRLKREQVSPVYLAAFLASIGGQSQFKRLNREGVKAGLNFDDIRGLQILLPAAYRDRSAAIVGQCKSYGAE